MLNKTTIYKELKQRLEKSIQATQTALNDIQASANNETKSTAGDKYETARAMAHLEKQKAELRLTEQLKQLHILNQINPQIEKHLVELGALVTTDQGVFFFAGSLGKIQVNATTIMIISMASPIGQAMLDKRVNEAYQFRGKSFQIFAII